MVASGAVEDMAETAMTDTCPGRVRAVSSSCPSCGEVRAVPGEAVVGAATMTAVVDGAASAALATLAIWCRLALSRLRRCLLVNSSPGDAEPAPGMGCAARRSDELLSTPREAALDKGGTEAWR